MADEYWMYQLKIERKRKRMRNKETERERKRMRKKEREIYRLYIIDRQIKKDREGDSGEREREIFRERDRDRLRHMGRTRRKCLGATVGWAMLQDFPCAVDPSCGRRRGI